jgi:uncharacterized membrane-anchored protein YitT (DUF2179 family)
MRSKAVGCCDFLFYGLFIMKIAVCFLAKVKIDMLINCYISINVIDFIFTGHVRDP